MKRDTLHNDIQHNCSVVKPCVIMVNVTYKPYMLSVFMLNVVMLSVVSLFMVHLHLQYSHAISH
jgi:hypothetical protein